MTALDPEPTTVDSEAEAGPRRERFEPVAVRLRHDPPRASIDPDPEVGWIRRLLPLVRAHKQPLIVALVTGAVAIVIQVAVPAIARNAIDAVDEGRRGDLRQWIVILFAMAVGRFAFFGVYRYSLFRLAWGIETDLRALLYDHLTTLSFSYYDRTQSGQVISRANSDIRSIQVLLAFGPMISMTVISFFLAFGFMLTIHVPLTLVALSTLPGVFVFGQRLRMHVFPLTWVSQARMAELATIVDENINGTRVVKSFAGEERQIGLLAKAADRLRWSQVAAIRARARYNPLIESLPRVGMALVLLYGGWLAIHDEVTIGTLFAFNAYVIMMQAPFRMFGFLLLQAQRASASAQRVYEVLDERPDVVERPNAPDLAVSAARIEFRDVRFSYPDPSAGAAPSPRADASDAADPLDAAGGSASDDRRAAVLRGFDLVIEPGETVAIVGRTGSGKSTIARVLTRFYDIEGGTITIDGQDIHEVTLTSLRHHIGLIFDEPFLFSTTVADNIAYGRPDADRAEIRAAATAAQADDFISALEHGYDTVVGERGYTLSGGQRQRIAIARTLLENPPVLILDDATSAIDVTVEEAIHAALDNLLRARTTILIAHRLSTIALADRVVLLEDGRVAATGTHSELMATEPRYVAILAEAETGPADTAEGAADTDPA